MAVTSTVNSIPTEKDHLLYALPPASLLFILFMKKWCTFEESAADTVHVLASVAQMLLATRRHPENRIKKKSVQ